MSAAALQLFFLRLEAILPPEFLKFIKNYATSDIIPCCDMCGLRSFDPHIIYDVSVLIPDFYREGEWEDALFHMCSTCSDISDDFFNHEYNSTNQMFHAIQTKRAEHPNYIGRHRLPQEEIPLDDAGDTDDDIYHT